jgi:hypothetical protein
VKHQWLYNAKYVVLINKLLTPRWSSEIVQMVDLWFFEHKLLTKRSILIITITKIELTVGEMINGRKLYSRSRRKVHLALFLFVKCVLEGRHL